MSFGILNLRACTGADITANIDDKDCVGHVNLPLVHIVQHLFCPRGPYFFIATVTKEADTDDDVAFESETFLRFEELFLEACTAAEGYDWIFADHRFKWVLPLIDICQRNLNPS